MSTLENYSELNVETCDSEIATTTSNTVEVDVVELSIEKSASCGWTVPGGVITFCSVIDNPSETDLFDVLFKDELDPRFEYQDGSFEVDESPETPTITGNTIEFLITELKGGTSVKICFKVKVKSV